MTDREIRSWLMDMDGVLVREEQPIPGAAEFLARLRELGTPFLVLTNNSIYTRRDLAARLVANGLDVPEAVKEAQDYTWHALQQGFRPGMGKYLPDHLFWARDPDADGETDVQPTMQPAPNTH